MKPANQREIDFPDNDSPDYSYFLDKLISQVQAELSQRKRYLLRTTFKWLIAYDFLKTIESDLLEKNIPLTTELTFFHGTLTNLKGSGIILLAQLKEKPDVKIDDLGLKLEDLKACVQELDYIESTLSSDMKPMMKEQIVRRILTA